MRTFIIIFFTILVVNAQEQTSKFEVKKDKSLEWEFVSQVSFTQNNKHYILGSSKYYQYGDAKRYDYNDGLILISFTDDFKFEKRSKVLYNLSHLSTFHSQILSFDSTTNKLRLLLSKDKEYYLYEAELNVVSKKLENMQEVYKIELTANYREDYVKIIRNQEKNCILQFDKKAKQLHVYELLEDSLEKTSFSLEEEIFKRFRRNFGLLQQIPEQRVAELDVTPGFQIHYNNDFIYILSGDCVGEGPSLSALESVGNCSSDYYFTDLHLVKINTKNNTLDTKIIGESLRREVMAYTIFEDELFFSFFKSTLISVNALNLNSFEEKSFIISKDIFEKNNLQAFFTNYSKKAKNIKFKEVDFRKFTFKFNRVPSIAIKKSDTLYDITLGNVKYKAYNSFGDWLKTFALASFTSLTSTSISGNKMIATIYFFNNEIPKIYETRFGTDFNGYLAALPEENASTRKEIMLNNLDYFIDKRLVSIIGDQENAEEIYTLFRDKNNWENFYVVKFPNTN